MLAVCARHGPAKLPPPPLAGERAACRWWWRPVAARRGVAARASSFNSRIGLDSQNFHTRDLSQLLWVGPVPGDIAEIEAYCRIFRAAEQLQNAVMSALCDPETGECPVRYDVQSEDLPMLEDKVAAVLGCMLALLNRGRTEVLSGRSGVASAFQGSEHSTMDRIPPLALFRGDMKRCCESMQVALASYLVPNEARGLDIWRRLQRLKNACYDAGFARADGQPCPTLFANWFPVYFSTVPDDSATDELEVAFWRGGQVSEEGLAWLLAKGFRTIVDLREEDVKDDLYLSAVQEAVSSGKIEVVNMPVEIGTAPSAEQVQKFAALVSDDSKKPIYLHSKEGVSRTSAMVSRWKQYATRAERLATQNRSLNANGKALKNDPKEQHTSSPSSSSNGSENGTLLESDRTVNNGEACDIDIEIARNNLEVTNALPNDQSTEQGELHGTGTELLSDFRLESNPLKAQFPSCNVFSRKEMTKFFRSKRVYPKSVLNSRKQSSSLLISRRKQNHRAEQNEAIDYEAADGMVLKSSNGTLFDNDYILSVSSGITNGKPSDNGTSISVEEKERAASVLTIDPRTSNASNSNGNAHLGSQNSAEKNGAPYLERYSSDPDDGNMCSSATGVVRVQSRRKAEMFLVRTDGFSCTREKVTESSLAFTHPSTQQQMLMWKSPPKTVLLLKKLGDELMEEAKEVASFLHQQEKMNVLVEPDVHDIFARIPGYGFVQTFYTQDTSDLHERVDFVTCLGGDGVILHASNLFRTSVPPVVSFNLGSLGFLTSHNFEGFRQDMRAVIHGNNTLGVYITLRMRLRCVIFRNGKAMPGKVFDVLNEVVVDRGSNPYLSKIECYEHNHLITKVQGDGVIVATPTGSTAYSTAAGGSMMDREIWTFRFIRHDPGRQKPCVEKMDRLWVSHMNIRAYCKGLGYAPSDSVYYQQKGGRKLSAMVELRDESDVNAMCEQFADKRDVMLHVFRNSTPPAQSLSPVKNVTEFYKSIPVVPIEEIASADDCYDQLMSDEEYDDPTDYWKQTTLMEAQAQEEDYTSDEEFDVQKETEELRKIMAEKKKQQRASKGKYSEGEESGEDMFDDIANLAEFDLSDFPEANTQMSKEISFGMQEEARQRNEKVLKAKALKMVEERERQSYTADEFDFSDPPSSDDGHEAIYGHSDEDEQLDCGRKRRRPRRLMKPRLQFNERNIKEISQLCVAMCFTDGTQFRRALNSYHIIQGRNFGFIWNKEDRVKVTCNEPGCPFFMLASKIAGESTFMIRQMVAPHTCGVNRDKSRITSPWLAQTYEEYFRADPNWKVEAFMECVKRDLNFEITKRMAYRAKAKAFEKVLGNREKQYTRIRDYLQTLLNKNPGSLAIVTTVPRDDEQLNPRFYGLFVSYNAQIKGFLNGCRPFIGLDGCFVKLANGAQVLAASARDGNNNMFPLAFGVVGKEDTENWTWFLQRLESAIGQGEKHGGWVIMSDRQKGLMAAVNEVFPGVEHRFCKRHLYANFNSAGFKGGSYKDYFDQAVYACTKSEYNIAMENMKKYDVKAWEWLTAVGKEHFSRHAFSPRSKTDLVVNNLSEVFNKYILDYRDKPIQTMMELIRTRLMTRMCLKRNGVKNVGWGITPVMAEKLEVAKSYARHCQAYQAGIGIWQVNSGDRSYELNLLNHTCSCYRWQLTGIPCQHACAAIFKAKERPETYMHPFFRKDAYVAAYAHMIYPVPDQQEWVKTNSQDIDPPIFTRGVGRPKVQRRRGVDEPRPPPANSRAKKGTVQCGNCGCTGHNVKGCKKPLRPAIALRVRRHVPAANATQASNNTRAPQVINSSRRSNPQPQTEPSNATGRGRTKSWKARGTTRLTQESQASSTAGTVPVSATVPAAPTASIPATAPTARARARSTRGRGPTAPVPATAPAAPTTSIPATAPTARGRARSTRGRGPTASNRVYGTTSRGRMASWFNCSQAQGN